MFRLRRKVEPYTQVEGLPTPPAGCLWRIKKVNTSHGTERYLFLYDPKLGRRFAGGPVGGPLRVSRSARWAAGLRTAWLEQNASRVGWYA